MESKTKQKHHLKSFFSIVLLSFLSAISLGLLIFNLQLFWRRKSIEEQSMLLEERLNQISDQQYQAEARIIQGESEFYLEQIARDNFNLKKPGESVVAFPVVDHQMQTKELISNPQSQINFFENLLRKIELKN